jgi:Xaa-Pro aminopeptidase
LKKQNLEAIFISQADNRRYLSGFSGSAGYVVITHDAQIIATDFRYVEQVKHQAPDFELRQIGGEVSVWFPQVLEGLGIKELAFEADDMAFSRYQKLEQSAASLGIRPTPTSGLVEELRMVKEPGEIALIKKAVALSDAALSHAAEVLQPGMTELELAWVIERHMREHSSEALPFEVIVAAGPNAAMPHHQPSARPIGRGEPVVIDIGARVEGYVSDLTRTLCAGRPDAMFKKIYNLVLKAQLAAEESTISGMSAGQADALARDIITASGYGDKFGHGLGHGLGLVAHEQPRLGPGSKDILKNGMVFTIEPGVYVPEWGGVRIEDTVLLEHGKITPLSHVRK